MAEIGFPRLAFTAVPHSLSNNTVTLPSGCGDLGHPLDGHCRMPALPGCCLNRLPPFRGDEVPLTPLADRVGLSADLPAKDSRRTPKVDDLSEALDHASDSVGRDVLKRKSEMCHDRNRASATIILMPIQSASSFREQFVLRTKEARENTDYTQDEIADLLGISQGTYKNYETIRPLPHEYVHRFCALCRIDLDWLYTGKSGAKKKRPPKAGAAVTHLKPKAS